MQFKIFPKSREVMGNISLTLARMEAKTESNSANMPCEVNMFNSDLWQWQLDDFSVNVSDLHL